MLERLLPLVGIAVILAIAYLCSTNRAAIRLKTVLWGLGLQFALALVVLKTAWGRLFFEWVGGKINRLLDFAFVGSEFVFGKLGVKGGGAIGAETIGFIFAFQVLPTIIFIAALFAVLYYLGVMAVIVRAFAKVMTRLMGASGAESLNVAASVFMGQTEAPLTIRPFINRMTQSELMCIMTSGMAHVSGGIMGAYIALRHRGQTPAGGGADDGAGDDPAVEDVRARNRAAGDGRQRRAGHPDRRCEPDRRGCAGHGRRPAPGAQRRRDAHFVPGADRADQRAARGDRRGVSASS